MNSFGPAHYVPILRWKRAEQGAMVDLFNLGTETSILTPLIELVPSQFIHNDNKRNISVGNQLLKTAVDIFKYWGNGPFFADLWLLPKDLRTETNSHPLVSLGHEARMRLLKLIPTTGLGRTRSYQSAVRSLVANDHLGVCIRLTLHEIGNPKLESNLDGLLSYLSLKPEDADLVVDYQTINGSATSFPNLYTFLPHISEWRTFTDASGAFPDNLEGFNVGQHKHPRADWIAWNRFVHTNSSPQRLPSYSDYTIQHPIYIELAPDIFPNFSASIRYAYDDYWVVMRGEGIFHEGSPGFSQWPANAKMLTERSEFRGPEFSQGDKYIYEMGQELEKPRGIEKTGNAETWLRAGINHHMTYVLYQIANQCDF